MKFNSVVTRDKRISKPKRAAAAKPAKKSALAALARDLVPKSPESWQREEKLVQKNTAQASRRPERLKRGKMARRMHGIQQPMRKSRE